MAMATMNVLTLNTSPWKANKWISLRMRRCETIAKAISSNRAAIKSIS